MLVSMRVERSRALMPGIFVIIWAGSLHAQQRKPTSACYLRWLPDRRRRPSPLSSPTTSRWYF